MEEEQRKTEQSMGEKVKTSKKRYKQTNKFIQKIREILAVPILGKILLILLILLIVAFLLVGTVNFFQSMPNQTRDRLEEIIGSGVTWEEAITGNGTGSGVMQNPSKNQKVLVSAAMDLILKGYDLEGYGFLDPDAADFVRYKAKDSKEIKSIQSKYLEAYIAANEATYQIANGNNSALDVTRYSEDLVLQIITEGDPTAWVNKDDYKYFLEILSKRIEVYLDENNAISKTDLASQIANTISDFNNNSQYKQFANSRGENPQIRSITEEEILAYMNDNAELEYSTGLIVFQNIPETVTDIEIDRKNKQLIVTVEGIAPGTNEDGGENTVEHTYYYNLEGWLTKYARPYEFLLTLHLATMAPEFAYEVATSPETNAKVIVDFKQSSSEIELVVDDKVGPNLSNPATTGTPQIAQKGEILALEQCNTDMDFWYSQFGKGVNKYAREQAEDLYYEYADRIAKNKANAAATRSYKDDNGVTHTYIDKDVFNEVYGRTRARIDSKKTDIVNYIYDRAVNYKRMYWGIKGVMTLIQLDSENGTVKKEGAETGLSKDSESIKLTPAEIADLQSSGATGPSNSKQTHQMYKWVDEFNKLVEESYRENASELDDIPLGKEQNVLNIDIPQLGGSVTFDFTKYYAGEMDVDTGGITRSEMFNEQILQYWGTQGGKKSNAIQNALNELANIYAQNPEVTTTRISKLLENIYDPFTSSQDTCTYEMFNLGIEAGEYEYFIYIFQQIERLENLAKEIAALPSKVRFETQTPYIVQVTNHWFRNLTFRRAGTDTLEGFDAYSEDETRTNYQYYIRYFRTALDPLITIYAQFPYGDPSQQYLNYPDCDQQEGYKYNVAELRYNAIQQIDNPRVTDNSAYIRSLINDKEYIIYDGEEKKPEQLNDDAKEKINVSKISVNSYAALEAMPNETSEILVRNLKELFKNTNLTQDKQIEEFAETNSLKPLANIFPDYKPYTPWPNVWESMEDNGYTTMIFKNMNRADGRNENDTNRYHYLEAPIDGVITAVSEDKLEFTYRGIDGELYKLNVFIEPDAGITIRMLVNKGDTVTTGTNLAVMTVPESVFTYIIRVNLALTDNKGQKLYVPEYMEVPQKELTAEEIITLHNFIMNEGAGQGFEGHAALASVIFNRIKYPSGSKNATRDFVDAVDIFTTMEYTIVPPDGKNGSWLEKDLRTKLWGAERYSKIETEAYGGADVVSRSILLAIAKAARGYDPTKGGVPIGATFYAETEKEADMFAGKQYTIEISSHTFFGIEGGISMEEVYSEPYWEYEDRDDEDEVGKRYLLELCITIKNSYYFENSEVLEKIIAWAVMESEGSGKIQSEVSENSNTQTNTTTN